MCYKEGKKTKFLAWEELEYDANHVYFGEAEQNCIEIEQFWMGQEEKGR